MKPIGRTHDGGFIIEFTNTENELLIDLQNAVVGRRFDFGYPHIPIEEMKMDKVFEAILVYTKTLEKVSDLEAMVRETLGWMRPKGED